MRRSGWVLIWQRNFPGAAAFFWVFWEVHGGGKVQFIGVHGRAISASGT